MERLNRDEDLGEGGFDESVVVDDEEEFRSLAAHGLKQSDNE